MATYTITLNERTSSGKALMAYLEALGVLISKVSPKAKSSYIRRIDYYRFSAYLYPLLTKTKEKHVFKPSATI